VDPKRYIGPLLAGVLPLVLYAATACRDIFWVDTTEFMLVGRYLTVSHPPGYPLFTLIVRLASLVPGLALPYRLNLVAALAAAGSCVFADVILVELTRDRAAALLSSLLWGVSFELWQQATALEVYSFQALLLSVLILAAVKWHRAGEPKWLLLAFFTLGLGLANHTPIILWIPSLAGLVLASPFRPGARLLGAGVALTLLAVCLYLYVPLRASAPVGQFWTEVANLSGLFQFAAGRIYRYRLLGGGPSYVGSQAMALPALFGKQFLLAWALVVPGLISLWRSRRGVLIALLIGAAVVTTATAAYNIPDKEGYFLPAYFALLIVIGCGLAFVLASRLRVAFLIVAVLLVALPVAFYLPLQNRSRLHGLADLSHSVLAHLPRNAVVFTDDYSLYQGMRWCQSFGERPDIAAISQYYLAMPWYLDQLSRGEHIPVPATAAARQLWLSSGRTDDVRFGEAAKATARQVMFILVQDWLPGRRVFWVPADFSDWPREWHGLRLTLSGIGYEISGRDTIPDLDSPLLPVSRYRSTLYRDFETQDLCRRLAATASRRGILQFAAERNTDALRDFDLAIEYFPGYPQAIENKGIVFFFTGQTDSARYYLKWFSTLDPGSPEIPKVRAFLSRLDK
jgi:hypothetical protein